MRGHGRHRHVISTSSADRLRRDPDCTGRDAARAVALKPAPTSVAMPLHPAREARRIAAMGEKGRFARFGPYEADLVTGELRRDGSLVALQQQPFRLLQRLVERAGQLVTRDELRQVLWPDGTIVGFERGLTSAIRKVREALSDNAAVPTYIETLQGRGYRFIAPVTFGEETGAHHETLPGSRQRLRWIAAAVLVGVAAGGQTFSSRMSAKRLDAALSLSAYACVLKSQGRFEEAVAVIQQAHALAPDSARITAEVGFYLHAAGRYEDEFPMLKRAIAQDARSPDAWLHLGLGYARRADFRTAVEALEQAHSLAAGDSRVSQWLAWARSQQRTGA
jgi:DNA-binding winged helix-turn-helix (wHTH) protein